MNSDDGIFSSPEAKIRFSCYGHSLSGRFNQAVPVSHSLLMSSSILISLVPISVGLLIPLICFHFDISIVSSISAT